MIESPKRLLGKLDMAITDFSKHLMLSALLTTTRNLTTLKHRAVPLHNGVLINPAVYLGADAQVFNLHVYGSNPPAVTNTEVIQWTAINNWPTITEIAILNAGSQDVIARAVLPSPYTMTAGSIFTVPINSWEIALV